MKSIVNLCLEIILYLFINLLDIIMLLIVLYLHKVINNYYQLLDIKRN